MVGKIQPEQVFLMHLKSGHPSKAIQQLGKIQNRNYTDAYGKPLIHYAIESGLPEVVRAIAEHGADLNAPDATGMTPLQHVLSYKAGEEQQGQLLQMIQILLDKGADPLQRGANDQTPVDFLMSFANVEGDDEYVEHVTRLFELYGQQILDREKVKVIKAAKTRSLYPKGQKHKMNGGRQKMSKGQKRIACPKGTALCAPALPALTKSIFGRQARFLTKRRKNMKTRRGLKRCTRTRR